MFLPYRTNVDSQCYMTAIDLHDVLKSARIRPAMQIDLQWRKKPGFFHKGTTKVCLASRLRTMAAKLPVRQI